MPAPSLDALPKGYVFPATSFDLSPQWVDEYVAAVEDEAISLLGRGLVPPMAIAALALRALLDGAKLPPGAVHLGQELAFHRPVHVGERLSVSARVASRGERRGWLLMGVDLNVEGEDRLAVMTGHASVTMPAAEGGP